MLRDIRQALRLLGRNPLFALIAIGAIALGIGANTALFSVVDAVILKPLPFAEPERLVLVWETSRPTGANSTTWCRTPISRTGGSEIRSLTE